MNPKSVTSVYLKISNHQSDNQKSKPAAFRRKCFYTVT